MSMRYHLNRPRGNLLPELKSPAPPSPMETKIIDIDHYNKTGECLTPAEVKELKETGVETMVVRNKPTREVLAEEIKAMTIPELARKYDCTKTTISNWINEYGLQRNKSVIMRERTIAHREKLKEGTRMDNIIKPECYGTYDQGRKCSLCTFNDPCKESAGKAEPPANPAKQEVTIKTEKAASVLKPIDTPWDDLKVMLTLVRENYHDHAEKRYREAAQKLNDEYHAKAEEDFRRDMQRLLAEVDIT